MPDVASFRPNLSRAFRSNLSLQSSPTQQAINVGHINKIKEVLLSRPEDEPLLYNLGLLLGQQALSADTSAEKSQLIVEALTALNKAVKINKERDASWYNIATLKEFGGDTHGAMMAYRDVITVTKNTDVLSASYSNLVQLLLAKGDLEEAAIVSNEAVTALPDDDRAWTNLGIVLRENLSYELATCCFENAVTFSNNTNAVALNNLGNIYSMKNEVDKAYEAYSQAVEIDPSDEASAYSVAMILRDSGDFEGCKEMLQRCVAINPKNSVASFQLSALLGNSDVEQCPTDYVADLFDHYAKIGYDTHMVENLRYKVPDHMWDAFVSTAPSMLTSTPIKDEKSPLVVVELGAGTGLVGTRFRLGLSQLSGEDAVEVEEFVGVDLSQEMIVRAYELTYNYTTGADSTYIDSETSLPETVIIEENVYTNVVIQDCSDYLNDRLEQGAPKVDLVLAGDVLVYIGKLDTLFNSVSATTAESGRFIFSVEKMLEGSNSNGFILQESARFSHSKEYIGETANSAGLSVISCIEVPLRFDGGNAVQGYVFVLQKKIEV